MKILVDHPNVRIVNLTLLPMDPNAVILHGMHLVLTVLHLKPTISGIAVVVHVLVTLLVMMVAMVVANVPLVQ